MSAADIAHALGDARREGRGWRCRCPLHQGRSLTPTVGAFNVWGAVTVWTCLLNCVGADCSMGAPLITGGPLLKHHSGKT